MIRKIIALLLVSVLSLVFVACGEQGADKPKEEASSQQAKQAEQPKQETEQKESKTKDVEDIVIAVVPQQLGNPVFLDARDGAEKAAEELGIKLEWVAPVKADAPSQVEVVEGLIEKEVDGIAISCNHPDALKDVLKEAIDAGIKVSTFDADSPESGRYFYAGTQNHQAGKICGEKMVELTGGKGKVALLTGILGAFDLEARIKGFKEAITGTDLEIVTIQACEDDINKAVELVEQYTRSNPDLDAWFFVGGWPFFAPPESLQNLKEWKTEEKVVVTMDSFYPMLQFFDENMVDVAVGQNFYKMGYESVKNLVKLVQGEEIESEFIDTGVEIVTPENYEEIRSQKKPWN